MQRLVLALALASIARGQAPAPQVMRATAANQTVPAVPAGPALQSNGKTLISNLEIDGGNQPGTVCLQIGNNAQVILRDVNIHNCDTGIQGNATQFADIYSLRLYANHVGMKVYSDPQAGGGNSINFFGGQIVGNDVGVIFFTPNYPQGADYFWNTSMLENGVAVAAFGTKAANTTIYFEGGSPEANARGQVTFPLTVDGNIITGGAFFASRATFTFSDVAIQDAQADPWTVATNGSHIILRNPTGYGIPWGQLVQADATSDVSMPDTSSVIGKVQNLVKWPSTFSVNWGAYGVPIYQPAKIPNLYAGTDMSFAFAPVQGTTETNRLILPSVQVPANSEIAMSAILASDKNCTVTFGAYPAQGVQGISVPLTSSPTRAVLVFKSDATITPIIFANDAAGCTVSVSSIQIATRP